MMNTYSQKEYLPLDSDYKLSCSLRESKIYEVINDNNELEGIDLLELYYGNLWKTVLDRLHHRMDGHVLKFTYQGRVYNVFRKCGHRRDSLIPRLRLVK